MFNISKISDEDLILRGPGDFFGTKQHGYIKSKLANFIEDGSIIRKARNRAFKLIEFDPKLKLEKNQKIRFMAALRVFCRSKLFKS